MTGSNFLLKAASGWLSLMFLSIAIPASAQPDPLIQSYSQCGYIDKTGQWAIKPQFEDCGSFSQNLAPVKQNKKYSYINAQGRQVIAPQFDQASPFSEGLAAVAINQKWGYIDQKGNLVIKPQFESAKDFVNGVALVTVKGKPRIIYLAGKAISTTVYPAPPLFSEGLAIIGARENKTGACQVRISECRFGFVDRRGKVVIKPQFVSALNFSEGLAAVATWANWDPALGNVIGGWIYIDKKGKTVIQGDFIKVGSFSESLAAVWVRKTTK